MKPSILRSCLLAMTCAAALLVSGARADDARPALPRLLDLGAGKCIPCKQMKPILDELHRDYATQFETVFIDVWEHREEGQRHGIRMIPTQIFFDASGKELFRHEGFMAKKDILAKWQELGVAVTPPASTAPAGQG